MSSKEWRPLSSRLTGFAAWREAVPAALERPLRSWLDGTLARNNSQSSFSIQNAMERVLLRLNLVPPDAAATGDDHSDSSRNSEVRRFLAYGTPVELLPDVVDALLDLLPFPVLIEDPERVRAHVSALMLPVYLVRALMDTDKDWSAYQRRSLAKLLGDSPSILQVRADGRGLEFRSRGSVPGAWDVVAAVEEVPSPDLSRAPDAEAGVTDDELPRDAPIFIVHGSDTMRAESVARIVANATGRETIILRELPNLGRTLIEKFEQHASEASYAIIVLTADDRGGRKGESETRPRGRQNVVFEMGYFYGRLGREHVSVLIQSGVEKPSDVDGVAYITFDDSDAWKTALMRELDHAGFDIRL